MNCRSLIGFLYIPLLGEQNILDYAPKTAAAPPGRRITKGVVL